MSSVVIGKSGSRNASIDVDVLLRTRMLIQANSGKGKSWLLRRLAEQLFGKLQVIIIDPEGEFATLREKFGYVLVGKGGETPADPRSAALVAHKLLELKASAVCDLYEMKPATRHEWVQKFLDAMIDAPKNLWHPVVVMVDEAHVYCPEKGAGESIASEAMIGLATRGRKRGYSCIFATQRLGKLRKDAAAELLNVMIGGTFIDIDRKRAADALGIYGADQHKFFDEIKVLERGSFYALGPAIGDERELVEIGPVETSHPEAGSVKHAAAAPPAPESIAKMLPKLADLPKTAEEKARTESEMRKEIRDLKLQLKQQQPATKPADTGALERQITRRLTGDFVAKLKARDRVVKDLIATLSSICVTADRAAKRIPNLEIPEVPSAESALPRTVAADRPARVETQSYRTHHEGNGRTQGMATDAQALKAGARKMLTILATWHPDPLTRDQVGALAGFAPTGGTFSDYLSKLRTAGYISENGSGIEITEEGMSNVGTIPDRPESSDELVAMWNSKFKAGVGKMLDVLVEARDYISREDLGERSGYAASGGTFSDYLSQLRRARLIDERDGTVRAAEALFP